MRLGWKFFTRFFFPFCILACSGTVGNQGGTLLETKGLTCDAHLTFNDQLLVCGETAQFAHSGNNSVKDGYCLLFSPGSADANMHVYGNDQVSHRIERMRAYGKEWIVTGIRGEQKNKFIARLNDQFDPVWALSSDTLQTTDQVEMAVDQNGNTLFSCKHPSSEAYELFIYLMNQQGQCQWGRALSSVEILQDIFLTKDQQFFISFKQKGAYIDGQTRKRYLMNSFYKMDASGQLLWAAKFHLDDDQIHHAHFNKVVEDPQGFLYFIGVIALQPNMENAYIVKTNSEGKILWSKFYNGLQDVTLKHGIITKKGNLLIIADGYGKQGGLTTLEVNQDGEVLWSRKFESANYEQAVAALESKNSFLFVWDKLFTMGQFSSNQEGKSCIASELLKDIKPQEILIQFERFNGRVKEIPCHVWMPFELMHKSQEKIALKKLCN